MNIMYLYSEQTSKFQSIHTRELHLIEVEQASKFKSEIDIADKLIKVARL